MWHWGYIGHLSRELDAEVIVVPYPLAPTNNGLEIMPVMVQVYQAFRERAGDSEIIVAGDRCVTSVHLPFDILRFVVISLLVLAAR